MQSIQPTRGPLAGGNEAQIIGTGFLSLGGTASDITINLIGQFAAGSSTTLEVTELLDVGSKHIRFKVTDSTLRKPLKLSTPVDVQVITLAGSATLAKG